MDAGSIRDAFGGGAGDTGDRIERADDPPPSRTGAESNLASDRRGGGRRAGLALVALAFGAAAVAAVAAHGPSALRGGPGAVGGLLATGVVALAASSDGEDAIAALTERIERARRGEDVDFETDREGALGELTEAVAGLADDLSECERERDLRERVIDSAPVGITVADATAEDCPLVSVNDRFEELTGYEEAECLGENCRFLQGEGTADEPVAEMRRAIEAEEETTVELRNYRNDGTEFWNRIRLAPVENDAGEVTHFVGFQEDVTERVEREAELQRRGSLLDAVFEQLPLHIYVKDREARHVRYSTAFAAESGPDLTEGEIIGKTDPEVFDAEFAEQSYEDDLHVIETGEPLVNREEYVDHADEWNLTTKVPWRGADGEIRGLLGVSRQITERKRRQQELEQYRSYTDDILDAIDDVFYVLDSEGDLQRWNETLTEVTGYDGDEIASMHATDFIAEEDRDAIRRGITNIDRAAGVPLEARMQTKDGERIPYEIVASPMEDPDGERVIVGLGRDISERRERERQLEAIVQNTEDPIYIKDCEGRYEFANEAVATPFDADPADVIGKTDEDFFDEETVEDIRADDRRVVEDGESVSREVIRPIHGNERVFLDHKYPYRDDEGEIIGLMGISRDITERKAAERELRERERRLEEYREYTEAILDAVDDVFYVLDAEGGLQRWNETLAEVTGYGDDEMASMHATDFFADEDHDDIVAAIETALETGDTVVEAPFLTADGEQIPFEFVASRIENPDGETVIVGIGRDVSDRKAAKQALHEREQRLEEYREYTEDILDAIDDVFYVFDDAGRIKRWNESFCEVTGYTDAEIESMHGTDFFPESEHGAIAEAIASVFSTGEDGRVEASVLAKDGERIPYEFVASRLENPDGDHVLVGIGRDVSVRKARERELRTTKERLQKFIDTSPVGVAATDPDGRVTLWNDAMEDILGWTEEEILWEPYPAVPEGDAGEVRQRVLDGESVSGVELQRVRKDGEVIDISLSTGPVRNEDGEVTEIVGYIEDITERKERERELAARSAAIEQASDGMAILDENGVYEFVNQAHADVYGYDDPSAFLGETWQMCYDADERERLTEEALPALANEGDWRGEAVGVTADGERFPQELSLTVLDDGRQICVVRDITERKERERELERTTDLLSRAEEMADVGGWTATIREDGDEAQWTDNVYEIFEVPPEEGPLIEGLFEYIHPDDRESHRRDIERARTGGEPWDTEFRVLTGEGNERWVHSICEPVVEDGEVVELRGSLQDITERKERELALESLHEATRGLLGVEDDAETAELVVDTAHAVLDVAGVAVYLLDDTTNQLDALACSEGFEALCDAAPVGAGAGDSLLWNAYVTGTPTVFDDTQTVAQSSVFGPDVGGGLLVPIGDHGVFVVATRDRAVDQATRRLAETLVATTEAAFDRLASEETLRERDAELEARNRRLRRQIQITDLLRRIDQSLIQAESREAIESAVCDRLVESDDVAFAWIGSLDPAGDRVEPSAWAGEGADYLDTVSLATGGDGVEPGVATAVSESPTVVRNVVDDLKREDWRQAALSEGFQSVLSVPIAFEEYFYGVLTVYASEPDAFGDLEREVFAELGENVAHSMNAVETQRALHTDQRVELTLEFDAGDDVLGRLAAEADCEVEFAGLSTHSDAETGLFVTVSGAPAERVAAALDDLVSVSDYRLVSDGDAESDGDGDGGSSLFEVTVGGEALPSRFVRHGAGPQSIRATAAGIEAVVDVPTGTDVREFVEMLAETHPSVDLASRRTVERGDETGGTFATRLFEALTDRQLEVLRTAYFAGFFEWPRTSTGEDVAEMLDVSQPTVNRHLRLGQQRLLRQLFEESAAEVGPTAD
ncbi:PAS domain S-box protein [Halosimplex sp. TS25]|uniref:PAS domain S-box protein n=1 Tax=Halosimplex rarum TaxID=3396619 RepID=UPI0039ECC882